MTQEIPLVNCNNCKDNKCKNCLFPDRCKCAYYKHKESLIVGVKANNRMSSPVNEPKYYEDSRNDECRLEELIDNGRGNNSEQYALREITKLLISAKHLVSKIDIEKELFSWCKKYNVDLTLIEETINGVFTDSETFTQIKDICFKLGESKVKVVFGNKQLTEISFYLMGRFHIKRIELTGDLIFFNDQYYEKKAEALIRRNARECVLKSKNGDINEIVKMIEDTCRLITWDDLVNSTHIKCLLNGVYNIKTGEFSTTFDPEDIILNQIPHNYNEKASWKNIEKIVRQIITDDKDRQSFFDIISTALHPYTGIDYQFGGVGQAGTGKSQLCTLIKMTLGKDNVSNATIHLIAKDSTTQKDCAFKMVNVDVDLNEDSIKQIDVIKKWITQDDFTARGIYEHSTTFKPMSRLLFMANNLYEIANSDDAEAIYERSHLVRLDNKFRKKKDVEIKDVIKKAATPEELEGLIYYLLKNASEIWNLQEIHFPMDYSTVENTWNAFGNRIKEFVKIWIEQGVDSRLEHNEPWNKWLSYAFEKEFKPKNRRKFTEIFNEIVGNIPSVTRSNGLEMRAYSGIRLRTEDEVKEQTTFKDSDKK